MLELHVQVQGDIRTVGSAATVEGTLERLFDHVGSSSDFLLALLGPDGHPVPFGVIEVLDLPDEYLVVFGIFFDFGDHDFVEEIDLPEFLIVAALLVIFGVD